MHENMLFMSLSPTPLSGWLPEGGGVNISQERRRAGRGAGGVGSGGGGNNRFVRQNINNNIRVTNNHINPLINGIRKIK